MSLSYLEASARAFWLLDLEIAGSVYRFASEGVTVSDDSGAAYLYDEGLTDPSVSLVGDGGAVATASITISSGVDWALIEARGHAIEYAPCVLRRWWEGQPLERARVYLRGLALGVSYGAVGEALTFALTRDPGLTADLMIDSQARVNGFTWPVNEGLRSGFVVDPKVYGSFYNLVIGCPGHDPDNSVPRDAVPVLMVEWKTSGGTSRLLLALGKTHAETVRLHNARLGTSADSITLGQQDDLLGREVTFAEAPSPEVNAFNHPNDEYWCGFQDDATYGGGMPNPFEPGRPLRGAGDVILWVLITRTQMRVDRGRMAAHRDWLNQFKVDTYINTEINAWAWLEAAVLRWLPVIARESDEGIYFLPLRWDYTAIDAVADLSVERFEVSRLGAVSRLSQPIYNEITVNYRPARSPKKWYVGHTITAEPGTLATVFHVTLDDRITGSHLARASQAGPWGVRPYVVDIAQTWDDSTATLVAQLLLQRYAGPKRTVRYQADKEYEAIEPGSAITITDAEIHLSRAVAYVVDVSLDGDSPVLDLILLDHPVHSQRATT